MLKNMVDVPVNYTGRTWIESETAMCEFKNGKLHSDYDGGVAYSVLEKTIFHTEMFKDGVKHSLKFPAVVKAVSTKKAYKYDSSTYQSEYWIDGVQYEEKDWLNFADPETKKEAEFYSGRPVYKKLKSVPKDFTGVCVVNYHESVFVNGKLHNLVGPAMRTSDDDEQFYFIGGKKLSKLEWESHPEVVDHKIKSIIGE